MGLILQYLARLSKWAYFEVRNLNFSVVFQISHIFISRVSPRFDGGGGGEGSD